MRAVFETYLSNILNLANITEDMIILPNPLANGNTLMN